jgi:hypothetical protein
VIISEENYALIRTSFSLNDYLAFQMKKLQNKSRVQVVLNKPPKTEENIPVIKENSTKTVEKNPEKQVESVIGKPIDKLAEKQELKSTVESKDKQLTKSIGKSTEKVAEKQIATTKSETALKSVSTTQKPEATVKETPTVTPAKPKQEDIPLFKGLFAYRANEPHFVAIYIVSGTMDFEKVKAAFDAYNVKNYSVMNLKVSLETAGKQQVILIGSLSDAQVAKSYLLRMVKEKTLFEGLKGANYRNILGSHENLNTLLQKNQLKTYFEFMQEYYLK